MILRVFADLFAGAVRRGARMIIYQLVPINQRKLFDRTTSGTKTRKAPDKIKGLPVLVYETGFIRGLGASGAGSATTALLCLTW